MIKLEKYFEILENIEGRIAIINDKPIKCTISLKCSECKRKDVNKGCSVKKAIKWLMEEYIEPAKLNKKERLFCELVETGYIARDGNNDLYFYDHKPIKSGYQWVIPDDKGIALEVKYYTEKNKL